MNTTERPTANSPVYLVETQTAVDRLTTAGVLGITRLHGFGGWDHDDSQSLLGLSVVILPDNHATAHKHAARVALALQGAAHEVRILNLPGLPAGGTVATWFEAGHTSADLHHLAATTRPMHFSDRVPVAVVTELADVAPEPVAWLWPDWLPRGKLTLLGGHPGDGKSTLTTAIAAILSLGGRGGQAGTWPDGSTVPAPAGTIFLLAEDALGDTLRPRLDLHGADLSRICAIEAIRDPDGSERAVSLGEHLPALERRIVERDIALVVIDPLSAFLPSRNRNDDGDIRDLLTPLGKLAERRNIAVLGVMHLGKSSSGRRTPLQTLLGSTAFGAVARSVILVVPVPRADHTERRALAVVKSNLALKPHPLEWSRPANAPITWHGPSTHDLVTLFGTSPNQHTTRSAAAETFLLEALNDGPVPSKDLYAAALANGIPEMTLRRACRALNTESRRVGHGTARPWYLALPNTDWNAVPSLE